MFNIPLLGGFIFLKFSLPILGEMIQFYSYFSDGLKSPTRLGEALFWYSRGVTSWNEFEWIRDWMEARQWEQEFLEVFAAKFKKTHQHIHS